MWVLYQASWQIMTVKNDFKSDSPLSKEDLELIEATMLPSHERHYLRILAHCLACFKEMRGSSSEGPLPNMDERLQWCMEEPKLMQEKTFIPILLNQFNSAGIELETLSSKLGITPLELTTKDLINASITLRKLDPYPIVHQK